MEVLSGEHSEQKDCQINLHFPQPCVYLLCIYLSPSVSFVIARPSPTTPIGCRAPPQDFPLVMELSRLLDLFAALRAIVDLMYQILH